MGMREVVLFVCVALAASSWSILIHYNQNSHEERLPGKASIPIPGIDDKGRGVVGKLEVEVIPGNGKILTNIDHILFLVDTQFSMQTARDVAAKVTGLDLTGYNIIYDIGTKSAKTTQLIAGPSAGAAMAVATIAALENRTISGEVLITGTIEPDGKIGKVGGILPKAGAARSSGAKVLLVPSGQGVGESYEVRYSCSREAGFKICRSDYVRNPTIGDVSGIVVKEVTNITDALKYIAPQ
jgi:uncharacterized protein